MTETLSGATQSGAELTEALRRERLSAYGRLRGGFPIPLAGTVYWLCLGLAGYVLPLEQWSMAAFVGTGAIFPLALLFAKIFKNSFLKDRTAVTSVLVPAFASMLLFWPMVIAAIQGGPELIPLILAIGLSIHWPVIGWSYGRAPVFIGHAVIRALLVFGIWMLLPEARLTLLPFSVSAVYLATVIFIYFDSRRFRATT
ncbi:DUF7010 family protein [Euryhalocaulis caribicus]|uniref:DUF7010 family protein n=1 Tax=Euryhalocaulis caribicus TaxID=1161401 RepID=UPI0003A0FEF0|nr:hypothetical protein [Euryhalocaulis caribicus]